MNQKIIFSEITTDDLESIKELQPEGWTDIIPKFNFYIKQPYCYPIKVITNNKIVGIGSSIVHKDTAWLAHIIVHKKYRLKGIGSSIVDYLINHLKTKNIFTTSLIATNQGYHVYKKFGFTDDTEYLLFERDALIQSKPSKNIIKYSPQYKSILLKLDKDFSGEDRANVISDKLESSYLFIQDNEILGYYIQNLGEGLLFSNNGQAGIELMQLRNCFSKHCSLPVNNTIGIKYLIENNYTEYNRVKRMTLGNKITWKPDFLFNRIAGNLG